MRPLTALASLLAVLAAAAAVTPLMAQRVFFREVASTWGLDFRHHHGGSGRKYMQETTAGGVIVFDFDRDGDHDVFFVDGSALPGYTGETPRSILYRNDGGSRFVDVTERAGIMVAAYGCGGSVGDVDADGDQDLYVTQDGANQLFRNNGDGTFSDMTVAAGVGDPSYSSSAAFADPDRDGDLDLYVVNYLVYPLDQARPCRNEELGLDAYCHPTNYPGAGDRYYRNRGDGTFEDATAVAGFAGANGNGLGLVFADLDNDGWPDLYVANDSTPNFLFSNRGDGTFEDISLLSGTALSDRSTPEAGMGVAVGDVDSDGHLDILVTNYALETNALYRNFGSGLFADGRHLAGIAEPSIIMLGFGVAFADFDQDRHLDLVVANGHIQDNIETLHPGLSFPQRNQLLLNDGAGRLEECRNCGLDDERVSRALATGDLDGDGDLDLVIVNSNDLANVYENATKAQGHYVQVDLVGATGSTASGIGARLTLTVGQSRQLREVQTGSSYQSQHALTVHFGLAASDRVDRLEVDWPSGYRQRLTALPSRQRYSLIEMRRSAGSAAKR